MQLSLTARAIFSGARRRRRGAKGYARAKSGGGRASCISRELGCNNYYLSRPFATLSPLPTIILVRTTPCPSTGTVFQSNTTASPPPPPSPRCASQIELISGIYRAADFPFVLSYTADRVHERRYIVIVPVRIYTRTTHIYIYIYTRTTLASAAYNKFPTNNKSAR